MPVDIERVRRRQTLKHFMYTFMSGYETETAAAETIRSAYVPTNLKRQLMNELNRPNNDRRRIEEISSMGMYIHASCSEIMYYHSISGGVARWIVTMYVDSPVARGIFEQLVNDVSRITDDDVRFILSKYQYDQELRDAGREPKESVDSLMSLLGEQTHSPDKSLLRYYGNTVWHRMLRTALKKSVNIFSGSYGTLFDARSRDELGGAGGVDTSASDPGHTVEPDSDIYREFSDKRDVFMRMSERRNGERIEEIIRTTTLDDINSSDDDGDGGDGNGVNKGGSCCISGRSTLAGSPEENSVSESQPCVSKDILTTQFDCCSSFASDLDYPFDEDVTYTVRSPVVDLTVIEQSGQRSGRASDSGSLVDNLSSRSKDTMTTTSIVRRQATIEPDTSSFEIGEEEEAALDAEVRDIFVRSTSFDNNIVTDSDGTAPLAATTMYKKSPAPPTPPSGYVVTVTTSTSPISTTITDHSCSTVDITDRVTPTKPHVYITEKYDDCNIGLWSSLDDRVDATTVTAKPTCAADLQIIRDTSSTVLWSPI